MIMAYSRDCQIFKAGTELLVLRFLLAPSHDDSSSVEVNDDRQTTNEDQVVVSEDHSLSLIPHSSAKHSDTLPALLDLPVRLDGGQPMEELQPISKQEHQI